jgi:hypothetical protein
MVARWPVSHDVALEPHKEHRLDNQVKPESELSSVGGAVPTSPPDPAVRDGIWLLDTLLGPCDAGTSDHAWSKCRRCRWMHELETPGGPTRRALEALRAAVLRGAAPTSTPLDALIAKWRKDAAMWLRGIGENQNTRLLTECADELEANIGANLLQNEIARLRAALEDIADPITGLRHDAEQRGCRLDGFMAMQLSDNANWLKEKARAALAASPASALVAPRK